MAQKSWYTINPSAVGDNIFDVIKADKDQNYQETYQVAVHAEDTVLCTCYAGERTCRHKKMLTLFRTLDRIGKGWFYQYDTQKWQAPQNLEESGD